MKKTPVRQSSGECRPPALSRPATSRLRARLKADTRDAHRAIEAVLDLPRLTSARYRDLLGGFLGFYRPVEEGLNALGGWRQRGLDLEVRRKVPLLEADLRSLGELTPDRLPTCRRFPRLRTASEAFGCLYVLEGSTLGGQVIVGYLQAHPEIAPASACSFFRGYGARTGEMWREFEAALSVCEGSDAEERGVLASAVATFELLRDWLMRGRVA